MISPTCRLYVTGTEQQLRCCVRVLLADKIAFYYSSRKSLRVKSRKPDIVRALETEFRSIGAKTRREYD